MIIHYRKTADGDRKDSDEFFEPFFEPFLAVLISLAEKKARRTQRVTSGPASQRHIDQLSTCHLIRPLLRMESRLLYVFTVQFAYSSQAFPKITIATVELTWAMH